MFSKTETTTYSWEFTATPEEIEAAPVITGDAGRYRYRVTTVRVEIAKYDNGETYVSDRVSGYRLNKDGTPHATAGHTVIWGPEADALVTRCIDESIEAEAIKEAKQS